LGILLLGGVTLKKRDRAIRYYLLPEKGKSISATIARPFMVATIQKAKTERFGFL